MARKKWESWGEVYYHYLRKGWDNGAAALAADQWERRQVKMADTKGLT
jgi:hypothetical protein